MIPSIIIMFIISSSSSSNNIDIFSIMISSSSGSSSSSSSSSRPARGRQAEELPRGHKKTTFTISVNQKERKQITFKYI